MGGWAAREGGGRAGQCWRKSTVKRSVGRRRRGCAAWGVEVAAGAGGELAVVVEGGVRAFTRLGCAQAGW
jgi:hypothetical protein